jgi:nicotinamidase-related amidase
MDAAKIPDRKAIAFGLWKGAAMNHKHVSFIPANTAIVLVDHQPGVLAMIGSVPAAVVTKDPACVAAVKATNRANLVIAGILTDVCLLHSVVSALEAGYNVLVVADASGTTTTLADTVTYDRLRSLGAVITSTYGILFELYPDLSTADGQKAEAVATASAAPSASVSAAA